MQDHELRKLLLETCPIRPGQESRAWTQLRDRIGSNSHRSSHWFALRWLVSPSWRVAALAAVALVLLPVGVHFVAGAWQRTTLATANSQAPGIYATAFYSTPAQAQVVWLNGLEPATDKPTYLDPTSVRPTPAKASAAEGDPNSL